MAGIVDPGCICARVGGDEFAIVRPNVVSLEEPVHLARLITSTVVDPFDIEWARMVLGVGVGIAIAPGTEPLRRSSFRRADLALYRAKAEGRSLIRSFELGMDSLVERIYKDRTGGCWASAESLRHNRNRWRSSPMVLGGGTAPTQEAN